MPARADRVKVFDIDLAQPLPTLAGLSNYSAVRALLRLYGTPLASVVLPLKDGQVTMEALRLAVEAASRRPLLRQQLAAVLADPDRPWPAPAIPAEPPAEHSGPWPSLSVAVCTRNRPQDLARCVEALFQLDYPGELEILVIDNAPADDRSQELLQSRFPAARYAREERPGLDWARSRAIIEARGAILAYTDDDVAVDRLWARAIARTFVENPAVMAVTGLVEPLELETAAQLAFEQYGGFGRGYTQRWYGINRAGGERAAAEHTATGKYGTGANMAYRREVFDRIGGFDPALDVGTITNGGGDLEMFFRVIKAGFPLVYEPRALVRHRHRTDEGGFLRQIANNGVGFYAYLERCFLHFPEERWPILRQGVWWFWYWYIYRLLRSFVRPVNTTRPVIWAELRGGLAGLGRYRRASHTARSMARPGDLACAIVAPGQVGPDLRPQSSAVRAIDIRMPVPAIDDVGAYPSTRVLVLCDGAQIGVVTVPNLYLPISAARLREAILDQLGERLLEVLDPAAGRSAPGVQLHADVSIVVAASGDPALLSRCLGSLTSLDSTRVREIIVVDYSHGAPSIAVAVANFPNTGHLRAPRPDAASALSHGIAHACGAIIVTIDERATAPTGWLDTLLAPLADQRTMAVIGDQQPAELETAGQQLIERLVRAKLPAAGTLGGDCLRSATDSPIAWAIGGMGNAAFRAELFSDPQVGMPDQALGVAQLAGAADAYLYYRLLRAGHRLAVTAEAYVWLYSSRAMAAAQTAIERAAAARVGLELTLVLAERDLYALRRLLIHMPRTILAGLPGQLKNRLRGRASDTALLARARGVLRAPGILITARRNSRRSDSATAYTVQTQQTGKH